METGMMRFAGLKGTQCAQVITQTLEGIEGVGAVNLSYDTNAKEDASASVTFDETLTSLALLRRAVLDAGYQVTKPAHGEEGVCCGGCGG